MICIQVNGKETFLDKTVSLETLIAQIKLNSSHLAIAKNFEVIPHSQLEQIKVEDGDQIEILYPAGGG